MAPEPIDACPTAIDPLCRCRVVEPTNALFEAPVEAIPILSVTRRVTVRVHNVINRHGATLNTTLILILAFVVAIHCPHQGVPAFYLHGR